jgi:glycosyltransferase involved in cell wall biosynthesis
MSALMKVSLIISTYNWPAALELCLKSVLTQKSLPDEVILADDGSGMETRNVIESFQSFFPVPLKHIWHEDNGFRLAEIRNKAILASSCEYIIQIDGDLILHPQFIADHRRLATKGRFVSGSRLLLSIDFSNEILSSGSIPSALSIMLHGKNFFNALRIPAITRLLAPYYKASQPYYVKGCNMAFWKQDLVDVNGYNESITGWGKEDSEIAVRLINNGVRRNFMKFGGVCYHLYHKEASRGNEENNDLVLETAIRENRIKSPRGLDSHSTNNI